MKTDVQVQAMTAAQLQEWRRGLVEGEWVRLVETEAAPPFEERLAQVTNTGQRYLYLQVCEPGKVGERVCVAVSTGVERGASQREVRPLTRASYARLYGEYLRRDVINTARFGGAFGHVPFHELLVAAELLGVAPRTEATARHSALGVLRGWGACFAAPEGMALEEAATQALLAAKASKAPVTIECGGVRLTVRPADDAGALAAKCREGTPAPNVAQRS